MKSPLSAALAARRKPQMPHEEVAPAGAPAQESGPGKVEALLASLGEEEKLALFEMLKSEMTAGEESEEIAQGEEQSAPESLTDDKGMLKTTSGEQAALAEEGAGNPNDPPFQRYARANIAKLTKEGKLK